MRANQDRLTIQELQGCNDLIDEIRLPEGLVPWSHGGHFNERSEFERLRGKKHLATSTSSRGMILSLCQLQFSSKDAVVVRDDISFRYVDSVDMESLRTVGGTVNPLGPFIL